MWRGCNCFLPRKILFPPEETIKCYFVTCYLVVFCMVACRAELSFFRQKHLVFNPFMVFFPIVTLDYNLPVGGINSTWTVGKGGLKAQQDHSPGQHPGCWVDAVYRPEWAKALCCDGMSHRRNSSISLCIINAFLAGFRRRADTWVRPYRRRFDELR